MTSPTSVRAPAPQAATLRPAELGDAEPLAGFAARTFVETYGPPIGASAPEDVATYAATHFSPARQAAELADPAMRTLVAVAADGGTATIVGYAQLRRVGIVAGASGFAPLEPPVPPAELDRATVELARLYVRRDRQGTGLAARLLTAARAVGAAWGADSLWLSAYQENARAIAFYRKHGARTVGRGRFQMGAELQHDWLLALPVREPPGVRHPQ